MVSAVSVTLDSPVNNSWELSHSVWVNFTITDNNLILPWCAVHTNETSVFALKGNYTNVPNGSNKVGLSFQDSSGIGYAVNVTCYNGSDYALTDTNIFGVDATKPIVSVVFPLNGEYITNTVSQLVTYLPVDSSNLDTCLFYTNKSGTWRINTSTSATSGTQVEINLTSTSDGTYSWNVECNDTARNKGYISTGGNLSFILDTTSPSDIKILSPSNNTASTDSTPYVAWNLTTEVNFDRYELRIFNSTSFDYVKYFDSISTITSNSTTVVNILADGTYYIRVSAIDKADHVTNTSEFIYRVGSYAPTLSLGSPADESYTKNTTPDFNVTATSTYASHCILYLSANGTTTLTVNTTVAYTSGTQVNLTPSAMTDGEYKFNIGCNNTLGDYVNVSSSSLTVTVDTTPPTEPYIISTWHKGNSTNVNPILAWLGVTETNFNYYQIFANKIAYRNGSALTQTVAYSVNVTDKSTTTAELDLDADYFYNFTVAVYDKAGNLNISTNTSAQTIYMVDSTCGTLYSGWNLCGAIWTTAKNLSTLLDETGASMASVWNSSNQWQTCIAGVASNNCKVATSIGQGTIQHVWLYTNTTLTWNRTWVATSTSGNVTLNYVNNGWNIVGGYFRSEPTFESLLGISMFNTSTQNVSMFVMRYNENGTSIPFITQGGWNGIGNKTTLNYGKAMWVYFNGTGSRKLDTGAW